MQSRRFGFKKIAKLLLAIVCIALLSGCRSDLGECDAVAARRVVFLDTGTQDDPRNGMPMFEGQALTQVSCGNGAFCHAPAATGEARYGAPAGLDFDLSVPCDDAECPDEGVAVLRQNQTHVFDERYSIQALVNNGQMPPGALGQQIRDAAGDYVDTDTSAPMFAGGVPLPEVGSAEGADILRNWLACGAPVVERYVNPALPSDSGQTCRGSADCIVRVASDPNPPEPNWPSIYERVIEPFCGASCHGPGVPDFRDSSQLDLSTSALAYSQLVGRISEGGSCGGDAVHVVPGDPDSSLIIDKLENKIPSCGGQMPTSGPLPNAFIGVIRQWITAGALQQ